MQDESITQIAAGVEKIAEAVDVTKSAVVAAIDATAQATEGQPVTPEAADILTRVNTILEQVGAAVWAANEALELLTMLRAQLTPGEHP